MEDYERRIAALEQGHARLEQGQREISSSLDGNSKMTNEAVTLSRDTLAQTSELVELFKATRSGFRAAAWLAASIRNIALFAGACLGAWITFKSFFFGN